MSNMKALIPVALAALPMTAWAHGAEFHLGFGFGFWHDVTHLAPVIGGALLGACLIFAFIRWQDTTT
jgi:hypothetical protein